MFKSKYLVGVLAGLSLSGCVSMSDKADWDCGVQDGFGCQTISETADRILGSSQSGVTTELVNEVLVAETGFSRDRGPVSSVPKWRQNDIMKIHVMPFVDGVNSYHERSVIYAVVSGGGWSSE